MPPFATDVTLVWTGSPSVTLVHHAKVVRWNEMPFGRDTSVVLSSSVLDRGPSPPREGKIWGSEAADKICIANCSQTVTDSGMVTTDSLYELNYALSSGTAADPLRLSLPLNNMFTVIPSSNK